MKNKLTNRRSRIKSMVVKEFKQILRDARMRMMLFGVPVIMLLVFGYAVNTDVNSVDMAVLDRDRTFQSREFIRRFIASGYFRYYAYLHSPSEADSLLDRGEVELYVHIPTGFSKNIHAGKDTSIQVILDGTDSNRASVILSYVNRITGDYSIDHLKRRISGRNRGKQEIIISSKPLEMHERAFFNPDLKSRNFYLPGVLGLLVALITIMLTSMSVVKERETGTIEQIIVSPLHSTEFIAGKTLPFAIVGFIDIFVTGIITIFWFKVPFNGSFFYLLVCSLFYILSTLAVGLYISTISRTQQQAMLSTFLFFIPSILLSGFVFPVYAMPDAIQWLTFLNPMRYFITIIRGIFLKGVGLCVLWREMTALAFMGIILLMMSVRRFSRRLE